MISAIGCDDELTERNRWTFSLDAFVGIELERAMDAVQKQWFEETKLSWFERFLINVSEAGL